MVLPIVRMSGVEAVRSRVAARAGADRVGLVDDEERPVPAGELPHAVVVARFREDDAHVGQGRLHERDRNVTVSELALKAREVVELHDARRLGEGHRLADVPLPRPHGAVGPERGKRLVDGAVVAEVVDEHLRPAGDVAGEPDREAVGVRGRERELPPADAEPALELVGGDDRVLGGQHVGDAAAELLLDRADRGVGTVPGHRARVAQAEVDVLVAVDVREVGPSGLLDEERIGPCPLDHPVHGNTVEKGAPGALEERLRPWVGALERRHLGTHEPLQPGAIQDPAACHGCSLPSSTDRLPVLRR